MDLEIKLCSDCKIHSPQNDRVSRCHSCGKKRKKEIYNERRAKGECTSGCGSPTIDNGSRCLNCQEKSRNRRNRNRKNRVKDGQCYEEGCEQAAAKDCTRCLYHKAISLWYGSMTRARNGKYMPIKMARNEFVEWYIVNFQLVESTCLICGGSFGKKGPSLDHNHSTGEIRGFICSTCNTLEGYGIDYLKKIIEHFSR